uniref:Uncharacterized protein n=1 Tax=Knipowitschia caucasica TaxID=637954 RepID=A0AAV2M9Y8_KNICA
MTRATRQRMTVVVLTHDPGDQTRMMMLMGGDDDPVPGVGVLPCHRGTPRKMKIRVSLTLLHIFRKYFMVVCDLCEMFASTYGFITAPHAISLRGERG